MSKSEEQRLMYKGRLQSIVNAVRGMGVLLRSQPNARLHLAATVAVGVLGMAFSLNGSEWALIVLAITVVWGAEALNTALEVLADAVEVAYHPMIGKAKDVAAGAVLITAIGAVVIGLLVFVPYVMAALAGAGIG